MLACAVTSVSRLQNVPACHPLTYLSKLCVCSFTSSLSRVPSTHSHTCAPSVLENLHTTVLTLILRLFVSFVGTRTKLRHKNSKPRLHEEVDRRKMILSHLRLSREMRRYSAIFLYNFHLIRSNIDSCLLFVTRIPITYLL